ncbi:MAG: hypothetical protein HC922_11160 [Leptolyngbyaceae cyanobacterium SM2_3_12]|nr:hypothetical protein [Leptolyngbyaceae cyanobacterium SM2_3_12]
MVLVSQEFSWSFPSQVGLLALILGVSLGCQSLPAVDDTTAMDKIAFDLEILDADGLYGPPVESAPWTTSFVFPKARSTRQRWSPLILP